MKREVDDNNLSEKIVVYVSNSTGGQFASKIIGHFVIDDKKFRFIALAFGRIGGHNINLQLPKTSVNNLKKNIKVDLLGAILEARYEDARTKYGA